jgi:hypothetical protein
MSRAMITGTGELWGSSGWGILEADLQALPYRSERRTAGSFMQIHQPKPSLLPHFPEQLCVCVLCVCEHDAHMVDWVEAIGKEKWLVPTRLSSKYYWWLLFSSSSFSDKSVSYMTQRPLGVEIWTIGSTLAFINLLFSGCYIYRVACL